MKIYHSFVLEKDLSALRIFLVWEFAEMIEYFSEKILLLVVKCSRREKIADLNTLFKAGV